MKLNPMAPPWIPVHKGEGPDKQKEDLRGQTVEAPLGQRMEALLGLSQFQKFKAENIQQAKEKFGNSPSRSKRLRTGTHHLEKWVRARLGSGDLNIGLNDLLKEKNEIWTPVFDLIADERVPEGDIFNAYRRLKAKRLRTTGGMWWKDAEGKKLFVCEPSEMPSAVFSSAESDEGSKRTLEESGSGSGTRGGSETYRTGALTLAENNSQGKCASTVQATTGARNSTVRATSGAGKSFPSTIVSLGSLITQKKPRISRRP